MGIFDDIGDFVDSITSGRGQDRAGRKEAGYGGSSNRNVTSSPRPQLRPDDFAKQVERARKDFQGSDGRGSEAYQKMMDAPKDYNDSRLVLDDVPYFKGPELGNMSLKAHSTSLKTLCLIRKKTP